MKIWDQFTLQVYLSKEVYLDALSEDKFFPLVEPTAKPNVLTQTARQGRRTEQLLENLQLNPNSSVIVNGEEHIDISVRTTLGTSVQT